MTDHTAHASAESRARMAAPLLVFFVACFLFAGAVKFHVKGSDFWLARPAGAPVTCIFLAIVGVLAGRWFFGSRPTAIPKRMLAALVVLLPLMGLLGVVQQATHDAADDATPLGGTLGMMLAGPNAFGALGTTVAGISFTLLALVGAYLARRISVEPTRHASDPYAVMRTAGQKRAPETGAGGTAVAEAEEGAGEPGEGGGLFPADAELEPEMSEIAAPVPLPLSLETIEPSSHDTALPMFDEPEAVIEEVEPPRRMPILSGIVEEDDGDGADVTEEDTAMPFLAATLSLEPQEPETAEDDIGSRIVDEAEAATVVAEQETEDAAEESGIETGEPEVDSGREQQVTIAPPPIIEEDDPELDGEEADDPSVEEPESDEAPAADEPKPVPEWLAAPAQFHMPRLFEPEGQVEDMGEKPEILDVLDVGRDQEVEPDAPPERPRFRVKADYVREEAPALDAEAGAGEPETEASEPALEAPVLEESPVAPLIEPATEAVVASAPVAEAPAAEEPRTVEAQLEFPAMPEPVAAAVSDSGSGSDPAAEAPTAQAPVEPKRPRRRMRSAGKDWATWDTPSRERPRLRILKEDEPAGEETQIQIGGEGEIDDGPTIEERAEPEAGIDRTPEPEIAIEEQDEPSVTSRRVPAANRTPATTKHDDVYDRAVALVVEEDRCSVSLLQRSLGVTFGEATALIDRMYQHGVVGPYQPTGRRDVLRGKKDSSAEEG